MTPQLSDILEHDGLTELKAHPERFGDLRGELRQLMLDDLYFLCKGVLGFDKLIPKIHGPMCEWERQMRERGVRFTLGMAFRSGYKSTIWTVGRTVNRALRGRDVMIFHEASTKAEEWSRDARRRAFEGNRLIEWAFPELASAGSGKVSRWGDSHWELPNGARVLAAGLDTKLMGEHVDCLILDDIFSDPKGDKTVDYAERITNFVKMSRPLLKEALTGERHLIGVPWWVQGDVYAHYRAKLRPEHQFVMPLQVDGEILWPEAFPPDDLRELQADPYVYASQYLLHPVSQETAIFKATSIRTYSELPVRLFTRVVSVDPAWSKDRRAHKTGVALAELDAKGTLWVERGERHRLDARDVEPFIVAFLQLHMPPQGAGYVLALESGGPQRAFFQRIQDLLRKFPRQHALARVHLVEVTPVRDKAARMRSLAAATAAGDARIRNDQTGLLAEMYQVTGARNEENDMTDAVANLLDEQVRVLRPWSLESAAERERALPYWLREEPEPGVRSGAVSWMAA